MKKFAGTYIMIGVTVLLAGYTYWEYRHASEDLDAAKGERLAFSLKREDVDGLEMILDGQKSVLKREGENWHLIEPVNDLAENSAVEGYLFSVLVQRIKVFRTSDEPKVTNWAEFGLDPAKAVITVSSKGKSESLAVSSKNTFDGLFYVRQGDELLLGDRNLAQIIQRPATALRSRHLWRDDDAPISKVTIELPGSKTKFAIYKEKSQWKMEPQPNFDFDAAKFETWMNTLQEFLPSDFVSENLDESARRSDGLDKPSLTIAIDYKKKDETPGHWLLTLGQDKGEEVYLFTNQRPTVYKTSKNSTAPLRVTPAYFRNGEQPFQFDVELAREVRVHTDHFQHKFVKTDGAWVAEGTNLHLDQEKLVQLMTILRSLEAQEFLAQGGTGFKTTPQIQVLGDKGKVLFTLAWGDEYKSKNPWNAATRLRYARVGPKNETVGLESSKLDRLIDPTIVQSAAKKAEAK